MEDVFPELYEAETVLLIGANKNRKMFLDRLIKKKVTVDVLEVFGPNVEYLTKAYQKKKKIRNVYHMNVADRMPSGPYVTAADAVRLLTARFTAP